MKFQNYLENIAGIGFYPMFSLIVFFVFFLILAWRVYKMDRKSIAELSNIPLDSDVKCNNDNLLSHDWNTKNINL